jgi:hypothetical protein
MTKVFSLVRKSNRHGRPTASLLPFLITRHDKQSKRPTSAISIRINQPMMNKLRWRVGDFVTGTTERDQDGLMVWTLVRVENEHAGGCKLSGQGKDHGAAAVRFTVEIQDLDQMFPAGVLSYEADLLDEDGRTAVFREVRA